MTAAPTARMPLAAPSIEVSAGARLRPWRVADAPAILAHCQDPLIQRWTQIPVPYLLADAHYFLRITEESWAAGDGGSLALAHGDADAPAGSFGYVGFDADARTAEIGYWLAAPLRGTGLARAALLALTEYSFAEAGLGRVILRIAPENHASRGLARSAGYALCATGVTDARTGAVLDTFERLAPGPGRPAAAPK